MTNCLNASEQAIAVRVNLHGDDEQAFKKVER